MSSVFGRRGESYHVSSHEEMELSDRLPVGNYIVQEDKRTGELFLTRVADFELPERLYGDLSDRANRVLNTYQDRAQSTGVLLAGAKGSGKSLLAKLISVRGASLKMPTIIVNRPLTGDTFGRLLQMVTQPAIVLFDEFEKAFAKHYDSDNDVVVEPQQQILTLLDGVFPVKKLFVLTCNEKSQVDEHMLNRPGRLYYLMEFSGLDGPFVAEYCSYRLKNSTWAPQVGRIADLFPEFNFDMLQAIVEESNRYNQEPAALIDMLNVKPLWEDARFDATLTKGDKAIELGDDEIECDPLGRQVGVVYMENGSWQRPKFWPDDLVVRDVKSGRYVYEKGGLRLELKTKGKAKFSPDWKKLLSE